MSQEKYFDILNVRVIHWPLSESLVIRCKDQPKPNDGAYY